MAATGSISSRATRQARIDREGRPAGAAERADGGTHGGAMCKTRPADFGPAAATKRKNAVTASL
jgi:hypothetical protein